MATVLKQDENDRGKFRIIAEDISGLSVLWVQQKRWYGWSALYSIENDGRASINKALDAFDIALVGI